MTIRLSRPVAGHLRKALFLEPSGAYRAPGRAGGHPLAQPGQPHVVTVEFRPLQEKPATIDSGVSADNLPRLPERIESDQFSIAFTDAVTDPMHLLVHAWTFATADEAQAFYAALNIGA
jgi:hypothetical protein